MGKGVKLVRKTVSAILMSLLVISTLAVAFRIQPVGADNTRQNGAVSPWPNTPLTASVVSFSATIYSITFYESTLPPSCLWSVTLQGTEDNGSSYQNTISSYTNQMTFDIPTGNYQWSANPVSFTPSGPGVVYGNDTYQGNNGSTTDIPQSFQVVLYVETSGVVTFFANFLPNGALWNVMLDGATITASSD